MINPLLAAGQIHRGVAQDALALLGIKDIPMPATRKRVCRTIHEHGRAEVR